MHADIHTLPARLRATRVALGYSQDEVSDGIGCHKNTYRGWEHGAHEPKASDLVKLADFYDRSIDAIVGREPMTF